VSVCVCEYECIRVYEYACSAVSDLKSPFRFDLTPSFGVFVFVCMCVYVCDHVCVSLYVCM